jgi:hypothetical protein
MSRFVNVLNLQDDGEFVEMLEEMEVEDEYDHLMVGVRRMFEIDEDGNVRTTFENVVKPVGEGFFWSDLAQNYQYVPKPESVTGFRRVWNDIAKQWTYVSVPMVDLEESLFGLFHATWNRDDDKWETSFDVDPEGFELMKTLFALGKSVVERRIRYGMFIDENSDVPIDLSVEEYNEILETDGRVYGNDELDWIYESVRNCPHYLQLVN